MLHVARDMSPRTRANTKVIRNAALQQAVRLASSSTHTRRAALAVVNAGRPAHHRVSYGTLARALQTPIPSRGVLLHGSIGMHQNMIVDILRVACVINPICLIHICVAPVKKCIQWEATSSYRKDKNNRAECTKGRS